MTVTGLTPMADPTELSGPAEATAPAAVGAPWVREGLTAALGRLLAERPRLHVLGEDVIDPYGGAFGITRGLSTRFPERVRSMPLSEGAIVGVANGMALCGDPVVVEMMFADFVTLAFDQLVNFAAKSVSMYGTRVPMPLVVRCPAGGGRGYGPTHSQSPQKHFLGVPDLRLAELTPFHDPWQTLSRLLDEATPALFFEDKLLYSRRRYADGVVDDVFHYDLPYGPDGWARVYVDDPDRADCVIVTTAGLTARVLAAARRLLLEDEVTCRILVPSRLYPMELDPLLPALAGAAAVCVVEDTPPGGTWAQTVAYELHRRLWGRLRRPVAVVHAADSVIPTAGHLEREVLVSQDGIYAAVRAALDA